MTAEEEQKIRERAYALWEQESRPDGRDLDHRLRAEAEIAAERLRGGERGKRSAGRRDARAIEDERLVSARQAAEALFTANREVGEQSINQAAAAPASGQVRRPRVVAISPTASAREEQIETPIGPEQQITPKITQSQCARIRTLARYGMTARQVAELYGVALDEIQRILRMG